MSGILVAVALTLSTIFTTILLSLPSQYGTKSKSKRSTSSPSSTDTAKAEPAGGIEVQVLVLGDIGRSPRMQYHATSIANHGAHVQLIGYYDSPANPDVSSHPRITIIPLHTIPSSWQTKNKLLFLVLAPFKVLFQIWSLWLVLGYRARPSKWMIVQNPPSIPTLVVAQVICFLRHTRLIIDWHNFGSSILALKLSPSHPMVSASKWYEHLFSRGATAHFCVTDAMGRVLGNNFKLQAPIFPLHDRPAKHFQPLDTADRTVKLGSVLPLSERSSPILTNNTRLIVSSTSWTADEDFSILIDALCIYSEKALTTHPHLPEILAIITGKGPQRDFYHSQIQKLQADGKLEMARIRTLWLDSIKDYATLLGCADLGVSLHTSSSGVDLPMKVVDMFGAGIPVLGWDRFEAWAELVAEGVNGKGFSSAQGLVDHLIELFGDDWTKLARLRGGAIAESKKRWEEEWDAVAGKFLGLA